MKKIKIFIFSIVFCFLFLLVSCDEEPVAKYKIQYDLDGGTSSEILPSVYTEDDEIILPSLVKDKYNFVGWYLTADFSGNSVTKIDGSLKEDITLYAKWEKILVYYNINYDPVGGTLPNDTVTSYLENTTVSLPIPSKEGYRFLGWYENDEIVEQVNNKDYDLVAKWERVYKIVLITDGGILDEYLLEVKNDEDIILPIPSKEGYRFLGWTKSADTNAESYITIIEKGFEEDWYLIANWERVYDITYNPNGGMMPDEYILQYVPGTNQELPIPSKNGYSFQGWSLKFISGTHYSIPISLEEDLELTAIWKKEIYTVRYVLNNNEIFLNKDHLFASFFGDFYDYLLNQRNANSNLVSKGINNLEEFYEFCGSYTGGAAGMSQVGNLLGSYFLKQRITKNFVNNLPENPKDNPQLYISIIKSQLQYQTEDDGFIGYCLANNKYVEFIDFLVEFFFWWRIDEAYTGSSSDPDNLGSDFFASPWASMVDTAKFFYYEKSTLPKYFTENEETPKMYDRIPNILTDTNVVFEYEYDWELGLEIPQNLKANGYEFGGWYFTSDYTGEVVTSLDKNIYHDIVLYGKFIKQE